MDPLGQLDHLPGIPPGGSSRVSSQLPLPGKTPTIGTAVRTDDDRKLRPTLNGATDRTRHHPRVSVANTALTGLWYVHKERPQGNRRSVNHSGLSIAVVADEHRKLPVKPDMQLLEFPEVP